MKWFAIVSAQKMPILFATFEQHFGLRYSKIPSRHDRLMKKLLTLPIQPKQTSNGRNNQSGKVIKVYVVQSKKERTEKARSSVKTG